MFRNQRRRWVGALVTVLMIVAMGAWTLFVQPLWLLTGLSPLICPHAVYAIATDAPVVALTIDDGPDLSTILAQSTTTHMLDVLKHYQAQATFFLISDKLNTTDGATLAQRIVDEGHELGNHFTEDIRSITAPPDAFQQGLQSAEQTLAAFTPSSESAQTSDQLHWFRPAGGWCSQQNAQVTQAKGYQTALGSIWPYDTHLPSVTFASQQILKTVHPGSIIILHDSGKKESDRGQRAVQILATVLPKLQSQGYTVTTLSELSTYGPVVQSNRVLPKVIDRIWQRAIAGWGMESLKTIPSIQQWGWMLGISIVGAIAIVVLGFRARFLRYEWATPPSTQSKLRFYSQITATAFFFPALAEELIFRLLLLPSPREITDVISSAQWVECAVSLALYVGVHPFINGPLRDQLPKLLRGSQREKSPAPPTSAHTQTFCQPIFLALTTIVGSVCTLLYLLSHSIWPPVLFHWCIVASWLLGFSGYRILHPSHSQKRIIKRE